MHELDLYLDLVRRQLRVGRRRAEAICAELRSHLEAQALQFEREGMSREQAMAQAVARFGEPKELAKRLVTSNSQYRRDEFLKAMWLGLIVGAAVFYAFAVIMYLMRLQSIYGVIDWRTNVVVGGTVGGVSGLVVCVFGVQVRAVARVVALVGVAFWMGFMVLQYVMSEQGYVGPGQFLAESLPIGGMFVLSVGTTSLAAGHAVSRWVLGSSTATAAKRTR